VNQVRVRKGLPYSFSLAGTVSHLYDSGLWGIGLEVGFAPVEGYRKAPDIAIVAGVGTLLGTGDFLMLEINVALILSKSFSVAGLFTLAPYAGYDMMYVNASSHLTSVFAAGASQPTLFAFDPTSIFRHRVVLGLTSVVSWVTLGVEMTIDGQSVARTYAFKTGVAF